MAPRQTSGRQLEASAFTAVLPVVALVPVGLLALAVFWLPVHALWNVPFWLFALVYLSGGVLFFWRPVQRLVLTRLLGARRPSRAELEVLRGPWRAVTQAARVPEHRFVLSVLDADDVNAFACGGHLVVVTTFAIDVLPDRELTGVLAHELSHHLGLHTVALTVGQWLSLPIVLLARVGFLLETVARAATDTFAQGSPVLTFVGRAVSVVLTIVAWVFQLALLISNTIGNVVGKTAELQADRRVVEVGYGRELAAALRHFIASGQSGVPSTWRDRLAASHPPPRTRVAYIEALLRARRATR